MLSVTVVFEGKKEKVSVAEGTSFADAVRKAGINPETVLIAHGKDVVPETEPVEKNCTLTLIKVISGG